MNSFNYKIWNLNSIKLIKLINSISFDLFIRKMQLKYQIVHKNIIYLFIISNSGVRFDATDESFRPKNKKMKRNIKYITR